MRVKLLAEGNGAGLNQHATACGLDGVDGLSRMVRTSSVSLPLLAAADCTGDADAAPAGNLTRAGGSSYSVSAAAG